MPVKIRLQRKGRKKRPFYQIVAADARAPRDGRFIEKLGTYNPMTKPATIELDRDRAFEWLEKGAQPTDTARAILRFKGVFYKKHLMRGVKKGSLTMEEAEAKYQEWIAEKDAKIAARVAQSAEENKALLEKLAGVAPVAAPQTPEPEVETEAEAEAVVEETPEAEVEAPEAEATETETAEAPEVEATKEEE